MGYDAGRHAEARAVAGWLVSFCERIDDLVTLAFLHGCEFAGADMDELDEERADAAQRARERFASEIRRA